MADCISNKALNCDGRETSLTNNSATCWHVSCHH